MRADKRIVHTADRMEQVGIKAMEKDEKKRVRRVLDQTARSRLVTENINHALNTFFTNGRIVFRIHDQDVRILERVELNVHFINSITLKLRN